MSDTTFDEARRCPVCSELGRPAGTRPADPNNRRAGMLHMFRCENTRCKKTGRDWLVQVRPDGTIPEPSTNRDKNFYVDRQAARAKIEKARAGIDNLVRESLEK